MIQQAKSTTPAPASEWMPHIWQGCDFFAWMRLLVRNCFAVHPEHLYIAFIVTFVSLLHTLFRWLQELLYGAAIQQTAIKEPPIFIIGHWRTGTTLLHELLILDERHGYPTTYECLVPNHFLISERFLPNWLTFLVPSHRPMDNMAAGWDRPQEDEFALCMLGQPSPYLTIAFPNHPPQDSNAYDLEELPSRARASWKKAFVRLLQSLTFKQRKTLVLKSPTHSFRVKTLLELFPHARFVHIVRDPYIVYPSTLNLWKTLYKTHGLQRPTFHGLEEQVFDTFRRLYEKIEEARRLVPPSQFHEIRYEDLIRDPVAQMRRLYEKMGLGEFDRVQPRLEQYLAANKGYQTNRYSLSADLRATILQRWGDVIRRYGYADPPMDRGSAATATEEFRRPPSVGLGSDGPKVLVAD